MVGIENVGFGHGAGSECGSHGLVWIHRYGRGRLLVTANVHVLDQLGVLLVLDADRVAAFVKHFGDQAVLEQIVENDDDVLALVRQVGGRRALRHVLEYALEVGPALAPLDLVDGLKDRTKASIGEDIQ